MRCSVARIAMTDRQVVEKLKSGLLQGDVGALSRAITLCESHSSDHRQQARDLLGILPPTKQESVRLGISGVPGVGKSTFIEALGLQLIDQGLRVAVLAVDPSSSISGGSILGDKTRMPKLSASHFAFIRPSPTGGHLGGVSLGTRATILLCEAAGYDVIIVETVGVGQNEITVRALVDFYLLMQLAGGGDELQGLKKGVMEIADAILVNKADGDNRPRAEMARQEYEMALHYMAPATPGWQTKAYLCSALSGDGVADIWQVVQAFIKLTQANGAWKERRSKQLSEWLNEAAMAQLREQFIANTEVEARRRQLLTELQQNPHLLLANVNMLVQIFLHSPGKKR
jgi:LAO/AO transport system kinase